MVNLMRCRGSLRLRLVPLPRWQSFNPNGLWRWWPGEWSPRSVTRYATSLFPRGCPESLLFVPESVRTSVLQWGHSSSLACHPGATRTHRLIKQRFWWPSMVRDARQFVAACPICAAGKGSNRPPAGLLQPLSVPSRPWSHIAMDFVTGLPLSDGKTVVLTVVDRFSKATPLYSPPQIAFSEGDSDYCLGPRFPHSWPPGGRGLWQGSPVCVKVLDRVLSTAGSDREPVLWISPAD